MFGRLWDILVTVADTRVGDADASGRSERGVKPVEVMLGGSQSPGGRIWGFPKRRGSLRGKSGCAESPASEESLSARKNLRK